MKALDKSTQAECCDSALSPVSLPQVVGESVLCAQQGRAGLLQGRQGPGIRGYAWWGATAQPPQGHQRGG